MKKVDGFAALMTRPDVIGIVDGVARFYEPDLPPHTREFIELIARPEHEGSDYGEQLGDHALVETRKEEAPAERLDVVLHELFHRLFSSARYEKKRALADRFAESKDPFARAGYGLLNESLATAFGNGLIARAVNRADFEKRRGYALGLYHDRFVDPNVKAILPWIEKRVTEGKSLYEPSFIDEYLPLVATAFPKGLAPILHLRPLVSVYDPSLEAVERHFYGVVAGGWIESHSSFGTEGREFLAKHPTWGTAVVVLSSRIDEIKGVDKVIDASAMKTLHTEIAKQRPFVLTLARANAEPVVVLVAPDAASMQDLMDRFGELDTTTFGVWN